MRLHLTNWTLLLISFTLKILLFRGKMSFNPGLRVILVNLRLFLGCVKKST